MLRITLRDLQFRRRQLLIAVVGAGVVFGLALLLSGVSRGFTTEAQDTVDRQQADAWVLGGTADGPFGSTVETARAADVQRATGATVVRPMVIFQERATMPDGSMQTLAVIGVPGGASGSDALADKLVRADPGEEVRFGDTSIVIGKKVRGRTIFGGQPIVVVDLPVAQKLRFNTTELASAFLLTGGTGAPGPGVVLRSKQHIVDSLLGPMEGAIHTVDLLRLFMWLVAAIIVGAITYLSALERIRDFAVLKAVGGGSGQLASSTMIGAVIASLLAAVLAVGIAFALAPFFPMPVEIQPIDVVVLFAAAVMVGVLSSLAALRRVLKVDPALAFGS